MNLTQIADDLKAHFESAETTAKTFLGQHLPQLSSLAEHAAANPLVDAAMNAAHLSPEILSALADTINKADAAIAALTPPPAPAEAEAPAEAGAAPADEAAAPEAAQPEVVPVQA
jgi:hypothetical protein